jgi:hypothetical protein
MTDELHPQVQVDIDRDKIKRAVKEALDDKRMEEMAQQMTDLSTQITQGFARVETRQDVANGKLMKHEIKIDGILDKEKADSQKTTFWQRNQDKLVWGIVGVALMIFYYLLTNNGFPKFLN